jgi:Na+/proline symporter
MSIHRDPVFWFWLIVLILAALAIFVLALAGMTFHQQYERGAADAAPALIISVMNNGLRCVGLCGGRRAVDGAARRQHGGDRAAG